MFISFICANFQNFGCNYLIISYDFIKFIILQTSNENNFQANFFGKKNRKRETFLLMPIKKRIVIILFLFCLSPKFNKYLMVQLPHHAENKYFQGGVHNFKGKGFEVCLGPLDWEFNKIIFKVVNLDLSSHIQKTRNGYNVSCFENGKICTHLPIFKNSLPGKISSA